MPDTKKADTTDAPKKSSAAAKPTEEALRLGTLLEREQISPIEASGFLAAHGLSKADKMTRSTFQKKLAAWRNQPVHEVTK